MPRREAAQDGVEWQVGKEVIHTPLWLIILLAVAAVLVIVRTR